MISEIMAVYKWLYKLNEAGTQETESCIPPAGAMQSTKAGTGHWLSLYLMVLILLSPLIEEVPGEYLEPNPLAPPCLLVGAWLVTLTSALMFKSENYDDFENELQSNRACSVWKPVVEPYLIYKHTMHCRTRAVWCCERLRCESCVVTHCPDLHFTDYLPIGR